MFDTILFYIDTMQLGGAERVMAILCNYFCHYSKRVILINDIIPDSDKPEYELNQRIERFYLSDYINPTEKKNGKISRIKALRRLIIHEQPSAVISFLGPPNIRAIIATLGLKNKTIVSVRNDPFKEYGSGIKRIIAKCLFAFADGFVFQTEQASSYFSKKVQKKATIIFNPVDDKFYEVEWTGENKEVAVVGRLQPQKNPLLAVEAFSLLLKYYPDFKIVFYGDNELREDILKKGRELGIQESVVIFGKTKEVENKLAKSALFLLSSDYEGMPNALLEAIAVGVPCVATDCPCGGPKAIITNENQGILVECGNATMMAEAMRSILDDKQKQLVMSCEERKRAEEFRTHSIVSEWVNYIYSIINE